MKLKETINDKIYSSGNFSFFAIKLVSIQGITETNQNIVQTILSEENRNKHIKFIDTLIGKADENIIYEICYVCKEINVTQVLRKIDVYLICQLQNYSIEDAQNHLITIYQILNSTFDEYDFEILDSKQVKNLINRKEPEYIYQITRKVILDQLDTLESGITIKNIGFVQENNSEISQNSKKENYITYIFPFKYSVYYGEKLFADLSYQGINSFTLSIKIQPTLIQKDEENFIEEQITKCEKFAQISILSSSPETERIYPTLQKLARDYQSNLLNFLFALKRNTALMTVEIVSSQKIPEPYLHTLASYISAPESQFSNNSFLFTGGYEIHELKSKKVNKNKLSINIENHPLLPDGVSRLLYVFSSEEISCAFRFPPMPKDLIPNFNIKLFKERLAPIELIEQYKKTNSGTLIGYNIFKTHKNEIRILEEDLKKHVYIIGQTGTGKSTILETMMLDCIRNGKGVCFIDPHGDLFKRILGKIPEKRINDVVIFDPADSEYPVGFNFLEYDDINQRYFIANEFVNIIRRLLISEFGVYGASGVTGPIFYKYLRNMLLLVMSDKDNPGTLIDLYISFSSDNAWRRWYPLKIKDPMLEVFVENELKKRSITDSDRGEISLGEYVASKLQNFVFDPLLRNIFIQKKSTINILDIINKGKILLVNLAKGELSEENSRFLGMVLMTKIMSAAMTRVKMQEKQRKEFYLFVDEFQNIATNSFITLLSEARKFGISLTIANQFIEQIEDSHITLSIFGNVGTFICFRLGQVDAKKLEQKFLPYVSAFHLANLPNWHAYVTTLHNGRNTIPFIIQTILDKQDYSEKVANRVRETSRAKYSTKLSLSNNERTKQQDIIDKTFEEILRQFSEEK